MYHYICIMVAADKSANQSRFVITEIALLIVDKIPKYNFRRKTMLNKLHKILTYPRLEHFTDEFMRIRDKSCPMVKTVNVISVMKPDIYVWKLIHRNLSRKIIPNEVRKSEHEIGSHAASISLDCPKNRTRHSRSTSHQTR